MEYLISGKKKQVMYNVIMIEKRGHSGAVIGRSLFSQKGG